MKEGAIGVKLDRERELYFDINVLAEVDDQLRIGIAGLLRERDWRVSDVRTILWAGLKSEDPKLTPNAVGDLIFAYIKNGGTVMELIGLTVRAIVASGLVREEKKTIGENPPSPGLSNNGSTTPSATPTDR